MTRTLAAEIERVREHFDGALALLDSRDVSGLDRAAVLTRMLLRQALVEYQRGGVFPRNHDFADGLRPALVDGHGTRCAMAHLMELGGAGDLVAEVAGKANHAYVDDLASDPRFTAWLEAAGLTVEEAARIQPSYGCVSAAGCLCQMAIPPEGAARGVIEAKIVSLSPTLTATAVVVHGKSKIKAGQKFVVSRAQTVAPGDKVLVVPSADEKTYELLANVDNGNVGQCHSIGPNDPFRNQHGQGPMGTITVADAVALRTKTREACYQSLQARDRCWGFCYETMMPGPTTCVYGQPEPAPTNTVADPGIVPTFPPPPVAPASSVGPPAPKKGVFGCSTAAAGGETSSVAVLLAVVGAMVARRRLAR